MSDAFLDHGPRLLAYLTRQVGPQAAEDVLSETFHTAWDRRASFDARRGSLPGWLFGIASMLIRNTRRSWAIELKAEAQLDAVGRSDAVIVEDVADTAAGRVDAGRRIKRLAAAIRDLPEADRDVLLLSAWGGLNAAEIAEALDIPHGTVRSRLHRVRTRLQRISSS